MASTSEATFGARLANAEALVTHLKSFTGYTAPTKNISITDYDALIALMKTDNSSVTTKTAAYSAAVELRRKHFLKETTSVNKIVSPIVAAVKATMGKQVKEVADITTLVTKIRGENLPKNKNGDNAEKISQSERSYGSMTQNFSDLVSILVSLGANYAPANNDIKLPTLKTKLTNITAANNAVTTTYGSLKKALDSRTGKYSDLSERTQRIKEAVKSQYGVSSTEYKLIKGLKI